jgi:rhodanese-related sulfurtransferase
MKRNEIIIVAILLIGSFWAFTLDDNNRYRNETYTPCELVDLTAKADKFITPDDLAKRIMNNDPSIVLIDLREKKEFEIYSLPNAINIPIKNLLDDQFNPVLNQNTYTNVFFSNSSDLASKAWMICTRMGFKNNYILQGGLNLWAENILRPTAPKQTAVNAEFVKYNFRRAASAYFVGSSVVDENNGNNGNNENKTAAPAPASKKKKDAAGGGCN